MLSGTQTSAWRFLFAWCECMPGAPGSEWQECPQADLQCLLAPELALEEGLCWGRDATGSGQAHCREGGNRHQTKCLVLWNWS